MIENRKVWLEANFAREGGFVNHPEDNGGPTNMGITIGTLSDWRGKKVTIDDVRELSRDTAADIYMARYWNAVRGDQLPSGLDIYVADIAVNSGPSRAAKLLQGVVHTEADGFIGPKTIEACRGANTRDVLDALDIARREFLLGLDDWKTFGDGWTNRCNIMLALARSKVQARPVLAEMLPSQTALGGIGATLGGIIALWPQIEPVIRSGTTQAQEIAAMQGPQGMVAALMAIGGGLYAVWCRYRDWRTGAR